MQTSKNISYTETKSDPMEPSDSRTGETGVSLGCWIGGAPMSTVATGCIIAEPELRDSIGSMYSGESLESAGFGVGIVKRLKVNGPRERAKGGNSS